MKLIQYSTSFVVDSSNSLSLSFSLLETCTRVLFTRNLSRSIPSRGVRMPLINYKPSNWKSGETRRNVITLTARDSLLLRGAESTARSRLQISAYHPIDYPRATTNFRPLFPSPPAFPSVSKLTGYTKVELPKRGEREGFRLALVNTV